MANVAEEVARWMGILSGGLLIGEEAERSAIRARLVLGGPRLVELRKWFDAQTPEALADLKTAVIEAVVSIAYADGKVADDEVELANLLIAFSELDEATQAQVRARIATSPSLDLVVPRITHPAIRELVLVMAWQMASADGRVEQSEHGAYGVLADKLDVSPTRAHELRTLFRDSLAPAPPANVPET